MKKIDNFLSKLNEKELLYLINKLKEEKFQAQDKEVLSEYQLQILDLLFDGSKLLNELPVIPQMEESINKLIESGKIFKIRERGKVKIMLR